MDSRCICEKLKPGQGRMLWPGEGWETWLVRRKNGKDYSLEFRSSSMRLCRMKNLEVEEGKGYRFYKLLRRRGDIPVDAASVPVRYCPRCGRPLYEEMAEELIGKSWSEQAEVLENRKKKADTGKNGGESSKPYIRAMLFIVLVFNALLLILSLLKF